MTYDLVHSLCDKGGLTVDIRRLTAFVVRRESFGVGPWCRVGAWVPVGGNGWAYVGRGR